MIRVLAGWLYFWGIAAALVGGAIYLFNQPNQPSEDDLVKYSGFLVAVRLEKDFNGTDIVLLKFRDNDQLYKYVVDYPMYVEVRDRVGIYRDVDVWYDKNDAGGPDSPRAIWGIAEHDPQGPEKSTVVTYQQIFEKVTETDRDWQGVGLVVFAVGAGMIILGYLIRRLVPHKPRDPKV